MIKGSPKLEARAIVTYRYADATSTSSRFSFPYGHVMWTCSFDSASIRNIFHASLARVLFLRPFPVKLAHTR